MRGSGCEGKDVKERYEGIRHENAHVCISSVSPRPKPTSVQIK